MKVNLNKLLIKPYEFGGSGGVYLARDMKEAIESFKESQDIMNQYAEQFGVDGNKYLIEKYIDSREEISVEVVCFNGRYEVITMTEKYLSPEPWFAEMAHLVPSHRVNDNAIKEMACKACEALKIEFGLAHVEIKIDGHNFWVIEAAARPGGDGIMDQIERAYELNPYSLHVSTYLNKEPFSLIDNVKAKATAAIAFLKADTGIIKEVNQPSVIDEEIHSLSIQADVGKISEDPICWRAREGVVEYTWPILFEEKTEKPIELTQNLSRQIFVVEKV
jgi:biotin carboxylase